MIDCASLVYIIRKNNQLGATIGSFIKIPKLARHVSGNICAHLQKHQTAEYSLWYEAPYMLPAVGLDADVLVHPEDGHN